MKLSKKLGGHGSPTPPLRTAIVFYHNKQRKLAYSFPVTVVNRVDRFSSF